MEQEKKLEMIKISNLGEINIINNNYNFTSDNEINEYLNLKIEEYFNYRKNMQIELGRFFTEVFEKLSKGKNSNQHNSTYKKFLDVLEINSRTVLRLRKRYKLYISVPEKLQDIIAEMSILEIELLFKDKKLFEKFKNYEVTRKELKLQIEDKNVLNLKAEKLDGNVFFNYNLEDEILNIGTTLNEFYNKDNKTEEENKKLEKIGVYLLKIKELLSEKN